MATTAPYPGRQVQSHFHPTVYKTIAGFSVLMVLGTWGFFGTGGQTAYLLAIASAFVLGSLGLPYLIRRMRRQDVRARRGNAPPAETGQSFAEWSEKDIQVWQSRIKGREAMIQAALPIAAVGVGMVVFALTLALATA